MKKVRPKIRCEGKGTWKEIEWGYCGVLIGGGMQKIWGALGKKLWFRIYVDKKGNV